MGPVAVGSYRLNHPTFYLKGERDDHTLSHTTERDAKQVFKTPANAISVMFKRRIRNINSNPTKFRDEN